MFSRASLARAPGRVRVKICGITNAADAAAVVALGGDALGLNFYAGSPRCLDRVHDAAWVRDLAGVVARVAVLVNPTRAEIDSLLAENLADAVQLHGDEDAAFCQTLANAGVPFAKAVRVRGPESVAALGTFHTRWIVLDAHAPGAYGGTGQTIDWGLAARCVAGGIDGGYDVILSGGLRAENVASAIARVGPFGVDVASGVEKTGELRRKDPARLEAFFSEVRSAEERIEKKLAIGGIGSAEAQ